MGKLTTHVLDTAHGKPGGGIVLDFYRCEEEERVHLASVVTNQDGRCDKPLLSDDAMQVGVYELEFAVGDYFAAMGVELPEPKFIDIVSIRFGISDPTAHYHVPLLVSPFSYSTYRGS